MHHLPSRYIPCDGRLTASAYFNPHSPHGERQSSSLLCVVLHYISIHAPRRGSDRAARFLSAPDSNFNPRSPHGERLSTSGATLSALNFNPRSPQGERRIRRSELTSNHNFNPRSPQGERLVVCMHTERMTIFQSTLPAWGATGSSRGSYIFINFNPRSPHGERLIMMILYI